MTTNTMIESQILKFSNYKALSLIHESDRALVYRGIESDKKKAVVIKLMRNEYPSLNELVQFRNQYAIAKNLNIKGVIKPYALERCENRYALIMEDIGGISLAEYQKKVSLDLEQFIEIACQLAGILHHLHKNCIIHKDIKPDNILIHPETGQVKLIDFSISTLLPKETQTLQTPNVLEGTLAYLSPEQTGRMNRGIDYRSDFYSLGITFYELLTGKLPFTSHDPLELIHAHIAKTPPSIPDSLIPTPLADIVMKLIAKNAEDRYQSGLGLQDDLEKCLAQYRETGTIKAFELGERDLGDRFLIPEKLYGRDKEVQILLDAFDRVSQGARELLLVAGYSGVGKTAAVSEVHKPIVAKRGYFIQGKYDQFQRNIPFSAFVEAFRDLMQQLLGESDAQLQQWQAKILAALGENGRIIIDVIPELENIIGQQPPVPPLSGVAAQNRFNLLFQKFVSVFATPEHPLAIFLDDLQWADSASLKLIQLLMGDPDNQYLLAIGAYRDNEVSPTHPLILTLEDLKKEGLVISQIALQPLDKSHVDRWITDTLLCDLDAALPLSDLTFQETRGNPFFTHQFLKGLHEDGWIAFNAEKRFWQCQTEAIAESLRGEDVVKFMRGRLQKLPLSSQDVLKLAACIGNTFDLEMLAIVSEKSPEETAADLWPVLREGLLIPQNETYKFYQENRTETAKDIAIAHHQFPHYKFLHDRVQQAACTLIPEDRQQATYLQIGRLLFAKTPPENREEILFDLVNAFNRGRHFIGDRDERERLCRLNLQAGCKAKDSTAYAAACEYLAIGMELLPPESWESQYELTFEFHKERGEVEYLNGNFTTAQKWIDRALPNARTPLEKAEIYNLSIVQYTLQANYPQAIEAGRQALQLLGVDLPREDFETARDAEIARTQSILERQAIADLAAMPPMTDPEKQMAVKLLIAIGPPTYRSHQRLWSVICAKATHLCLQYGNTPQSGYIYPAYGGLRGYALNNYQNTAQLLESTLQIMDRFQNRSAESVAYLMIGSSLRHWSHPLKVASTDYQTSYQIGLESSNLQYAAYAFGHNMYCRFFQGIPLEELAGEVEEYLAFSRKQNNKWAIDLLVGGVRIIAELRGITPEIPEEDYLQGCRDRKNWQVICIYRILKTQLLLTGDRIEEACNWAQKADAEIVNVAPQGLLPYAQHRLLLALASAASETEVRTLEQLQQDYQQLNVWAENCPANFSFARELLGAEIARLEGDFLAAIDRYDLAIAAAREQEFWHWVALANELAAKFYRAWGKEKFAHPYLLEAYYSYIRWGAIAKVKDLERRNKFLLSPSRPSPRRNLATQTHESILSTHSRTASSSGLTSALLDLETFIKAARAISAEIQLDRLLQTLMQAAMENAGADRGYFLLRQGKTWYIVGEGMEMQPLAKVSPTELSLKAIDCVRHGKQPLILEKASDCDILAGDPYIRQHPPQSLLCLPIFHQNKLTGLLYLENRLTASAFTSDRVEVLQLLCAQAAISLENARLYQQAQCALTDLQQAQLQLVQNEKMATLGNLVAGVAHEINNPLGFIGGNVKILQENLADLSAIVDGYREEYPEPSPQLAEDIEELDLDFLLEDIPKTIASMQEGVKRIGNISTSLRTFSRTDTDTKTEFNLHDGLDSTLLILKYRLKANAQRPAIEIVKNYGAISELKCYPGQLNQVFMNLLANAIDALDESNTDKTFQEIEKSPNRITIHTSSSEDKKEIQIAIIDNGKGMSEAVKAKIFEQGFTTKEVGKGTGLGMAIACQIIEEKHDGTITCQSEIGQGTEFIISLPLR